MRDPEIGGLNWAMWLGLALTLLGLAIAGWRIWDGVVTPLTCSGHTVLNWIEWPVCVEGAPS